MSGTTLSISHPLRGGFRRWAAFGALTLAAGLALPVWADAGAGGPPHGGHGMGDHGPMAMGDPAHVGRMADHMLDGLGASDAQRAQVRQIAQAAAADMKPLQEAGRALREKGVQLLLAPTIDAAAVESLRQQMLAQHDQASKRTAQTLLAMANVLTPEQRTKLGERMKLRGDAMRERMQRMHQHGPETKS